LREYIVRIRPVSSRFIGAEHEPFGLDQATAQGRRGLLILAGKVVLANRATDVLQNGERLAPDARHRPDGE
jgi:hypothetical protein